MTPNAKCFGFPAVLSGLFLFIFFFMSCTEKPHQGTETSKKNGLQDILASSNTGTLSKPEWSNSLTEEIVSMSISDQKYRAGSDRNFELNADSQSYIDSLNTKRLLEIITTYGYPTAERLHKRANTTIILLHAPESFFPEMKKLVEAENLKGNIYKDEYAMLIWHLNGREGKPEFN